MRIIWIKCDCDHEYQVSRDKLLPAGHNQVMVRTHYIVQCPKCDSISAAGSFLKVVPADSVPVLTMGGKHGR